MTSPKKFLILVLGLGLCLAFSTVVNADDDFDAEVEESMAERDATTAQARAMKLRAEREEAEAEARKKEAQKMKAAADARHKQAEIELVQLDQDIKASRAEQEQSKKEKAAAEKSIAKHEAKLKEGMALLQKLRGENEALRKLRDEQVAKIAAIDQKTTETEEGSKMAQLALENGKQEFEKGKLDLKAAQDRLSLAGATVSGEQHMKVKPRAPASAKMTMSKECGVFEKADAESKMLGKKKAGTVLNGRVSGDWVGYTLKDQRVVYVQKSCF